MSSYYQRSQSFGGSSDVPLSSRPYHPRLYQAKSYQGPQRQPRVVHQPRASHRPYHRSFVPTLDTSPELSPELSPDSSPDLSASPPPPPEVMLHRPQRYGLRKNSYTGSTAGSAYQTQSQSEPRIHSLPVLAMLPATTYSPPSPRGKFINHSLVRPVLSVQQPMMPTAEEIKAANMSRMHRSGSTSSTSSIDTVSSTRSEKRQGRLYIPTTEGFLDLLMEQREIEDRMEN